MIDRGHITTADDVKNAVNPTNVFTSDNMDDPVALIQFYSSYSSEVHLVTCGLCQRPLCLWIAEPKQVRDNQRLHPQGLRRITIGANLLSSRRRLDGHVGYQCRCGNDSTLAESEKGIVPQHHYDENGVLLNPDISLDLEPHHLAAYQARVAAGGLRPQVIEHDPHTFEVDAFKTERIK